ncbi:MAG: hypothetical protein HDQ88_03470, partial [Clostridia bacterium]|nr:hypothetical protein [Clostridia bacterium]
MATIDLTAGPDIADVARKLKELREAARMALSGVSGDVVAMEALLESLSAHVLQVKEHILSAQMEIGANQAWVQQLRAQADEVQAILSTIPDSVAGKALQEEIGRIDLALSEELEQLEQNRQKLQDYSGQLTQSQPAARGWEGMQHILQGIAGGLTLCQGLLKGLGADSE